MKFSFFSGIINIPEINESTAIAKDVIKNGCKYLLKETPELSIAITSEFVDNFEVNQITAKKTKIGNKKYP